MEQVLYSLPDGWKYQKLKTLIKMHYGKALKATDRIEGEVPVYGSNGVVGSHNEHLWDQPTVVIGRKGSVGEANLAFTPSWTIDTAYYVEIIDHKVLNLMYFYYFADRFDVSSISQKGVKPGINRNDYLNLSFPLPPINEQERIVEKLDALLTRIDTAIEHLQESVTLADALYASYVNSLLTPPENQPDSRNLSSSSGSWEWKKIEDVFTITSGKNLTKKDMVENGEYAVYGGNGVAGRFSDFNLDGTNIIIGRVGALCGNVRLISEKIWITDNAFFIKEYKLDISKEFLAKVLDALNLGSTANKAAQPVISYKSIKELTIPYPPLLQQEKIVSDLNVLYIKQQKNQELLQGKIENLLQLKASILDSAFKGEL
ncbi:restriction endonuclease subunit S [Vibrio cholerae]|uniref:restriction endonuclease subunit S n=1 Tax=Vibrio cholerae TaxID=666 RepID=UPI0018F0850D|nr:restriction endonuclease subunit S [Vibrio cholerae]MBJ6879656.1 restriction endonuclease subunit S [Vibrio cholerae]MBJ6883453.1 restriction endonuclease subunit S [Vibrio cholerae]MBJ6890812.1 restriction endonuclease subunit S [Vibrio cholerae]